MKFRVSLIYKEGNQVADRMAAYNVEDGWDVQDGWWTEADSRIRTLVDRDLYFLYLLRYSP